MLIFYGEVGKLIVHTNFFCNRLNDDILHIYFSCNISKEFWPKVVTYAYFIVPNVTVLNQFDIIFGPSLFKINYLSFIVLAAKYHIHG